MRGILRTVALSAWIVAIPTMAAAQGAIAGTIKGSSGAVLPGVGVEAASPAWLQPNSVLTARVARISAEFSF